MDKTNRAMLVAFALLALAQLASIQLMLLANRGSVDAAAAFEPIEIQIADARGEVTASRHELESDFEMTGNAFDWAIDGHGYFEVVFEDGTHGYTREGLFRCNAEGAIVTKDGYAVSPGITLSPDYLSLLVNYNGDVAITQPDGAVAQVGTVHLARFMNPDGLREWRSTGIFLETEESGPPNYGQPGVDGFGTVEQGFRPIESFTQAGGITVRIAPGQPPTVSGTDADEAVYESFRTSRAY